MKPELQFLQAEVEQLRQIIGSLKPRRPSRAGRGLMIGVGLALGLLAARWSPGEAQALSQDDKQIVCKSLRVVGPGGKDLLTLGADEDGGKMAFFGTDGKIRGEFFVADKKGAGVLNLYDVNKTRTIFLGTDEDGGIMEIYGLDGKTRTIVAVAPKQGGGLINLFDTKKKLRLVLEGSDQGAVIEKQ
jgi:hypothetical protein